MSDLMPKDELDEDEPEWATDPKRMGFLDHLEELRWTLMKPLIAFIVTFVVVMIFIADVKDLMMWPLFRTYTEEDRIAFQGLATRNLTGVYTAMMHIGLIFGIGISSPFFIYNIAKFLSPALTKRERVLLIPGAFGALVLFTIGCFFSFFLLLPKAIDVTIWMNGMMGFQIIWSPDSYFSFITWIVLGMGISFQFPLVVLVLVHLGIVDVARLKRFRRVMAMILIVIAAVLTPPDPITQVMMATPMYLLYELSIWVAGFVQKRREKKDEEFWKEDDEEEASSDTVAKTGYPHQERAEEEEED